VEDLPDVSQPRGPRTVYVELSGVPVPDQVSRFQDLLAYMPGSDTVIVRVEGHDDITLAGGFSLGPQHSPQVSVIFGGAVVYYDLDSVDMRSLTAGLDI
jgi:hypothetical protein